jgi:hypothetical protein
MQQTYQDAMVIVCYFVRPQVFITVTANPYWDEITQELLTDDEGWLTQTWQD